MTSTGAASTYINSIIHVNDGASAGAEGLRVSYTAPDLHNCTIISTFPSSTAFGIEKLGGAANSTVVKNTAIFGFGTAIESGAWGAGTDFNATDDSSLPAGSNNLTSLTTSDQFENVASDATLDLRLKTGNDLDGAGTPDSSITNDLDIFFNTRSLTAPSIGAYETVSGGGSTLSVDATVISPTFSVQSLVTIPVTASNISLDIDKPAFSSSMSVTLPSPTGDASVVVSPPAFSSSISVTLPSSVI